MDTFIEATILGLATASILAIAASGLVLTYTTTGIFNFAHGAMGMLGAFTYWQLRVDWGWPAPLALAAVLLVLAPLVGTLIEVVIMRGLTDAPETVRVVVSISLLVALLGLGLWIWSPQQAHPITPFWGFESIDIGGWFSWMPGASGDMSVVVTYHEITAFAVAILLAVGLRLLLFRSRPGLAMRAAVDDRPLSMLNGARPGRSAALAWAIGCTCAALGGILMSPVTTLSHVNLTLLIVNAYAAAMIGRLRSLPMTFAGAVLLGLIDSWAITYLPDDSLLLNRIRFVAPVIVLFVVLLVLRQPRPRGHAVQRTREMIPRPSWNGSLITAGAFVAAGVYMSAILTEPDSLDIARIVALAIIGLSLVPLVGFAGQLSLCQMSFAGIGAVVMAHHGQGGSLLGVLYAAIIAGVVGALVALPAIRLGGLYLALATAAFAVFMDQWVFLLEPFDLGPFTIKLFPQGTVPIDRFKVPFLDVTDTGGGLLIVLSVIFALLYLVVVAVRRSTFGQRLLAMKDSPAASATIGMNLTATKMVVFSLSAAMAGVGGALYGSTLGSASPDRFAFFTSLPMLLLGVVGGIGSAAGAILAGVLLGATPILVNSFPWYENIARVLPGTMGIALGRNPNGIIQELRVGFAPLAKAPVALIGTLAATAAVLGFRLADVLDGGLFALLLIAAVLGPGLVLRLRDARALGQADQVDPVDQAEAPASVGLDDGATVPLEWVGIDRAFTREDVARLDRELGLEGAR
jgi:branched-chain amino acid transport system permease protein